MTSRPDIVLGKSTSYKHDCDCFDFINAYFGISGVTGIVQQYLHMIDTEYLKKTLKMPIILKYATRDDFMFHWGLKKFSGRIIWPYTSEAHVSLDLNIATVTPTQIRATISVQFSAPICETARVTSAGTKMLKFAVILSHGNTDAFVNTLFIKSEKDRFTDLLLDQNDNQAEMRVLIDLPIFDQTCAMFHRRLIRAIYSEYHVDSQLEMDAPDHYEIPGLR